MTIGEVAERMNISISTIRFYDKEGLLLGLKRNKGGIGIFDQQDMEVLQLIECLKKSGMQIKDIKQFIKWCSLGDQTLQLRKEMFGKQKANIEQKIKELEHALSLIEYKCWYYQEALKDGNEKRVKQLTPEQMPSVIQEAYQQTHHLFVDKG